MPEYGWLQHRENLRRLPCGKVVRSKFSAKPYTIGTDRDMTNDDVYDLGSIIHYHSVQNATQDATCNSAIRQADTCYLSQKVDVSADGRTFCRVFLNANLKASKLDALFVKTFYPWQV